ncbi:MAG: hypothetical protein LAO77_25995 [Acidobacteriia bacterium]|nr:hypothetical protein [Terriglobia bacterium]
MEAGSFPGGSDVVVADTGSTEATLTATGVAAGTYYVRVRAKNTCGISTASNEVFFTIR